MGKDRYGSDETESLGQCGCWLVKFDICHCVCVGVGVRRSRTVITPCSNCSGGPSLIII